MSKAALNITHAERMKILRNRLAELRRYGRYEDLPKPAEVLAAEQVVSEWAAKNDAHHEAQAAEWRKRRREVEDAFLRGDVETGLRLLGVYETLTV